MIICPDLHVTENDNPSYQKKLKVLNNCIYNFGKKTYKALVEERLYCLLFKYYIESGDFSVLQSTDSTMTRNNKFYDLAAKEIYESVLETLRN